MTDRELVALFKADREAGKVEFMLDAMANEYFSAICRGRVKEWIAIMRGYMDLIESMHPALCKRRSLNLENAP